MAGLPGEIKLKNYEIMRKKDQKLWKLWKRMTKNYENYEWIDFKNYENYDISRGVSFIHGILKHSGVE